MHNVKLATRRCTSGMLHCGLLPPWMTGVKTKLGSAADLSAKYRSQMRVMIRLILGTSEPPKANVNMA